MMDQFSLEERIRQLEAENSHLRAELDRVEKRGNIKEPSSKSISVGAAASSAAPFFANPASPSSSLPPATTTQESPRLSSPSTPSSSYEGILDPAQIERYSRQLLLLRHHGGFGVEGQQALLNSKVLVVGAGGIGSTVILYLAACGVGRLSIVDFDQVDVSNLHRQVIHKTQDVGMNKAESARRAVHALNPTISCITVPEPLTESNALSLISDHDCIVDASDNPQTRYLINDACVLSGKPLVSGSAMGTEGQLTVYNYQNIGPCYRCLYPNPNATEGSKSCADNGVLGPVPGLIGVLQAVETIKVLTGVGAVMSDRLLMYDAIQCSFARIKKPPKQPKCPACSGTIASMTDSLEASHAARGPSCSIQQRQTSKVPPQQEVTVQDYNAIRQHGQPHTLIDVRVKEQFDLCRLPGAVNVPLSKLSLQCLADVAPPDVPVYFMCRRGIASTMAMNKILQEAAAQEGEVVDVSHIRHVVGGLDAWRADIDESFPQY